MKHDLERCLQEAERLQKDIPRTKMALIIDGKCLMFALESNLRGKLLRLSLDCNSVVCCRVSPLQKAQVNS